MSRKTHTGGAETDYFENGVSVYIGSGKGKGRLWVLQH